MVSGKYLPSQLRTQKAGPEPATRGAGAACCCCGWLRPNGSAKKLACGGACRACCFGAPPKNISNRPSAEPCAGTKTTQAASIAATRITRRGTRLVFNPVRNANSTQRNQTRLKPPMLQSGFTIGPDGKRALNGDEVRERNSSECAAVFPSCPGVTAEAADEGKINPARTHRPCRACGMESRLRRRPRLRPLRDRPW